VSESSKFIIVAPVEPMQQGDVFSEWPLHITVAPWFSGVNERKITQIVESTAERNLPLAVTFGEVALFGAKIDIPVQRINDESGKISGLHTKLINPLHRQGAIFDDYRYLGYKYQPHVTLREGHDLPVEPFCIDSLAVVRSTQQPKDRCVVWSSGVGSSAIS
jgi:2'-5' RNA ligase